MLAKEIEILKEQLDDMLSSDDYNYSEVLGLSEKLDTLIVRYLREKYKAAM